MNTNQLKGALEAMLFATGEPLEVIKMAQALQLDFDTIYELLRNMQKSYANEENGIELIELGKSFQLCTKEVFAPIVQAVLETKRNTPLSQAAMEVLAVIAYNQPVTKSFIEQIRGVDSSQTVNSLAEKGLIEEAGRLDIPGRPISYRTTKIFLRSFGIKELEGLPPISGAQTRIGEFFK